MTPMMARSVRARLVWSEATHYLKSLLIGVRLVGLLLLWIAGIALVGGAAGGIVMLPIVLGLPAWTLIPWLLILLALVLGTLWYIDGLQERHGKKGCLH